MPESAAKETIARFGQEPDAPEFAPLSGESKSRLLDIAGRTGLFRDTLANYRLVEGEGITPQIVSREAIDKLQGLKPGTEEYHDALVSLRLIPKDAPYVDPEFYAKSVEALRPYTDEQGRVDVEAALGDKRVAPAYIDTVLGAGTVASIRSALSKRQQFEQNNIRLADGQYVSISDWNRIPENYQTIGLRQGYDAMSAAMQADYDKWASQFTPQELEEIQSGKYQVLDFATNQFVAVPKRVYEEREALYGQYPEAGTSPGKMSLPKAIEAEREAQLVAIRTAKQAREQEIAKAQAEALPEPVQTYTYRDPSGKTRTVTADERKAILDSAGWSSSYYDRFTRDVPVVRDVLREALSFGGLDTVTFDRDRLAKQYENQKEITLAVLTGDTDRLRQLYEVGAFGKDEKVPQWWYKGRKIGADEREKLLAERDANRDLMTVARSVSAPPQAYMDALAAVQQQKDIEMAVKSGDVPKLKQLYQEGAFGSDLASYVNLVKYVEAGGRELAPVTAQDVKAIAEGFGTKKEYVDAVLKAQPTTVSMVKDVALAMVPIYGTIYFWDKMGAGAKAVSIATDALSVIPVVGGLSAAAKVAAGVGRSARIASAMKVVPKLVTREVFAPVETVLHPVQTIKALGSTAKSLVNVLNPRHIPGSTLSTVYSTVRLDTAILGDPVATMYVRDRLMALQAAGKTPVVQFGDKVFTLRSGTFLDEGGVVHASPNIRFTGEPEGFTVSTKIYPEGHPKAGQRMPDSEQGMFVANTALERFAVGGSAFGFEKGVASAAENIKAITDAAEQAKALGDVKKANYLTKLVDEYNAAIASKSIKALDKAESRIMSKLAEMAEDEIVAKINSARAVAGERYAIGDVKGAQEAMAEALAFEEQLQKARPGFAIFSPEVSEILVPSGKLYKGMVFQPTAGEFWSITMREMKSDRAAQLLKQAQDATRLGDKAVAARLTKEANDLIKGNKSGFRRVETAEMELKFPELTQIQQLKPRYTTTASDTGAKLWIYTTTPYSLKKALKAKLNAPVDTLRNIYDPAIKVRTIPMTRTQKLAKIDELLEQARVAGKAGDKERATILEAEANVIRLSLDDASRVSKKVTKNKVTGTKAIDDAIIRAVKMDRADELMQAAKRAEAVGDYTSADRLRRAADAIVGRRYVNAIARRAGTVSGLAEYTRALGAMQPDKRGAPISRDIPSRVAGLPERRASETVRDAARRVDRLDVRTDRSSARTPLSARVPDVRLSELRTAETDTRRGTRTRREGRTPDITRTPATGRAPEEPMERVADKRLSRKDGTHIITRTPDRGRVPDTGRIPRRLDTSRSPKLTTTTTARLQSQGVSIEGRQARLPSNSVAWRQGMFWKWIPREDFKDGVKPRTLPRGLTPVGAKFTDLRTPQETVQIIGDTGVSVPDFRVDLGKTDIAITDRAQSIIYAGRGEKTDVGNRIPNTTQGMTVESTPRDERGHAYARKVYPAHSVSRTAISDESKEPVRSGEETTASDVNRPKIADDTQATLGGAKTRKTKEQSDMYFDEDPEWLSGLEPPIMRTRKRRVSRVKSSKQRPIRGRVTPSIVAGGVRL